MFYLAEDVDGVSSFERELVGLFSVTVPQTLEEVRIVVALVHGYKWNKKKSNC